MGKRKIVNRIGMFDLFKGIGMLGIVAGHTFNTVVQDSVNPLLVLAIPFVNIIMPVFMAVSGYGFRSVKIKKCLRQQAELMLKPYLYVLVSVTLLHMFTRWLMLHSVKTALIQTWSVTGGFLMGLPDPRTVAGTLFYNCGPTWFIIALFLGWCIFDIITQKVPEKYQTAAVIASATAGWLIGLTGFDYFCLPQGLIAVSFIYTGYLVKKKKLLSKGFGKAYWILWVCGNIVLILGIVFTQKMDNMAESIWSLGIISILLACFLSAGWVWIFAWISSGSSRFQTFFEAIGCRSLYIFTIHTVEMHGIPWYKISEKFPDNAMLGEGAIFVLRVLFIAMVIICIEQGRRIRILHSRKA